ncbi:MAG: phosphatase PAP2 family protein [Flavipsychrobacter sp.]
MLTNSATAQSAGRDITWLRDIYDHRNTSYMGAMKGVTNSVYPITAALPLAQLIYGYSRHDSTTKCLAWQTVAGLAVNTVLVTGLKYGVNRTRPYDKYPNYIIPYTHETDPSFPSGHTSYAFAVATTLTIEYPKWYVIVPSYAWAATVGYSRMYLGMHYPSDVLAGAVIGAGSAWLGYKGNQWLHKHRHLHKK